MGYCVVSTFLCCDNLSTITQLDNFNVATTLRIIVNILVHGYFPLNMHCLKNCILESDPYYILGSAFFVPKSNSQ